jgi:phosphoglycolate phosphatase
MILVLFDVDGTLVDSQDFIVEAQRRAFLAHGLTPPDRKAALAIVGLSLVEAFTVLAGETAPVESLADAYRSAWTALRDDPAFVDPFYPGALEAVATLAAMPDVRLGIATGKSRRGIAHLFDKQGWHRVFATIQTADDHPSKPAPDMVLKAMADTGIAADRTFMVGDTGFDMAMARAAGAHGIGVAWGYHDHARLVAAGAERVVASFDELLAAFATARTKAAA